MEKKLFALVTFHRHHHIAIATARVHCALLLYAIEEEIAKSLK